MKKVLLTFFATILVVNMASAENIFAGYLDTTATGSAQTVKMPQVKKDGYNTVIFAFATVKGTEVTYPTIKATRVKAATEAGLKVLISLGGQYNTFKPGQLTSTEIQTLASNLVMMVRTLGANGIDFDLEVATPPTFLDELTAAIQAKDPSVLLSAAPQVVCDTEVTKCQLVTTGANSDYDLAIKNNRFDYLFIQAYNTPPQNDIQFMVKSYPLIAGQLASDSKTKIIMGQPTQASAGAATTIYHPTEDKTLTTKQVTAELLPELKELIQKPQFGGMMAWSLNHDYDPDTADHQPGSFGFYLNNCINNAQCDTQPIMPQLQYQLDVTNNGQNLGIQVAILGTKHGHSFVTDWLNTVSGSSSQTPNELVYSAVESTDPSSKVIVAPTLANLYNLSTLQVLWFSYVGGKTGACKASFSFSQNTHIIINSDNGDCSIQNY
jgi:chitinase